MKNISVFLSENFHFLVEKISVYLNRLVFVMSSGKSEEPFSSRHGSNYIKFYQFST